MRLDGVEIKANVAGADVAAALDVLELDDSTHMRIWFYEDLRAAVPPFPLFEQHLILRVRVKKNGDTDSTVKLRPCDRSRLTAQWLDTQEDGDLEFTLEQDRPLAGGPVLAASCQVDRTAEALTGLAGPPYSLADLLTDRQKNLMDTGAEVHPDLTTLTALGPIEATRWKQVGAPGAAGLAARAERWRVRGQEFLEISVRAKPDEADGKADDLRRFVTARGITLDTNQKAKTDRVLALLA